MSSEQILAAFEQCKIKQGGKDLTKMAEQLSALDSAARKFEGYFLARKEGCFKQYETLATNPDAPMVILMRVVLRS